MCVSRPLSMKQAAKIMHICSVIIYPLEKRFIGTSTSLARDKNRVLPTDSLITHCRCEVVTRTRPPICLSFDYNLQCPVLVPHHTTPSNVPMTSAIALSKSSVRIGIWYFQFSSKKRKRTWCAPGLFVFDCLSPSKHPRPDHAPIVVVIQSEHLKYSISQRNQSAKHPDSGCFGR